ncbi:MAG: hypothetical protein CMM10_01375 [Rhodospirillaceae bacterium]|nr:hypothetical protein [Rhodospirillaceae bacterium]MDP6643595.1 ABC transporter substrate-binding protein [Rhodospirillales bacterium]
MTKRDRSILTPRTIISAAFIGLAVAIGGSVSAQAQGLKNVTFSLDFIPLGRHAPWYVGVEKGFYKAEGLKVKIITSKGSSAVIQAVESGLADIGFVDVPGISFGRAGGSTIKMVAVNYQKAPYAIFSLDNGANVTTAKQLEGLTVGSGAGSFTPKVIRGFMVQKGLDPNKLKISNVAPPAWASMLLSGKVPAIDFYVMSGVGLSMGAKKSGANLTTYLLGDNGLSLYANGIGAKESYIKANPDVMKKFVRGSLKAWQYTLRNPKESAKMQRRHIKALKEDIIVKEIAIIGNLAVTEDTKKNGLGWFSKAKMQQSLDFVRKYAPPKGKLPSVGDLFVAGFLPDPPIKP